MRTIPLLFAASALVAWTLGTSSAAPEESVALAFEGHISVPGLKLWVTDTGGTGQPVVFLHSSAVSSRLWEKQVPAFAAAGYRVITYDRRGWDRTIVEEGYWDQPGSAPDDLLALLDVLGIDRAHLVGIAAGAGVALDFAVSYPERVWSLSITNHSFGGIRDPEFLELNARLRPQPQFGRMPPEFRELGLSYQARDPEGTKRWLELEHMARPPAALRPPAQPRKNDLSLATLAEQVKVPTMVTAAAADLFLPPEVMRMVAARIPNVHTVVFKNSGHNTGWEDPEAFNHAVLNFIGRHAMAPAFEGHVSVPGVKLWVTDTGGRGQPVVFLHSNAVSSRLWEKQVPAFAAAGYRVIAYDRRGWDRTIVEEGYWDQPGSAPDDLLTLLDVLGIERAHLVGIAGGAGVALDFAVSYPQRVRSLSVINHSFGGIRDPEFLELNARLRPPAQFGGMPPEFRELGLSYQARDPEGTKRWLELEHIARPPAAERPPAQRRKNDLSLATLGQRVKVPTMVTAADADLFLPPEVMRMVAARIPNVHTVVFEDGGHNTGWEHPEAFNRAVLDFIGRH